MRSTKLLIPDQVVEEVAVIPLANIEERCDASFLDFVTMKRYNEEVNFAPCLAPVAFRDTVICYKDSTRKRFKSQTLYQPRVKPRTFSDTLIVFPKRPQRSYVTCVDYHIDECRRWFKTSMEFKALTYTTNKIITPDLNANHVQSQDADAVTTDTCGTCNQQDELPGGPGASQIFLPRWEKDPSKQNKDPRHDNCDYQYPQSEILFNGDILQNGYEF